MPQMAAVRLLSSGIFSFTGSLTGSLRGRISVTMREDRGHCPDRDRHPVQEGHLGNKHVQGAVDDRTNHQPDHTADAGRIGHEQAKQEDRQHPRRNVPLKLLDISESPAELRVCQFGRKKQPITTATGMQHRPNQTSARWLAPGLISSR